MLKRYLTAGCALFFLLTACLPVAVSAEAVSDEELIIRAVAVSYPEADFGAKVALCAVILNRMEDEGFPDTAADVIRASDSGFNAAALCNPVNEKIRRITRDACYAAYTGADPTGGLLYFDVLPKPTRKDNRADFEQSLDLTAYRVVVSGFGFY